MMPTLLANLLAVSMLTVGFVLTAVGVIVDSPVTIGAGAALMFGAFFSDSVYPDPP